MSDRQSVIDRPRSDERRRAAETQPTAVASDRRGVVATTGVMVSVAALVATLAAATSLNALVQGGSWFTLSFLLAMIALGVAFVVRLIRPVAWAAPFAAMLTAFLSLGPVYAGSTLAFGIVPTPETIGRFGALLGQAAERIQTQSIPADPDQGLDFLLVVGVLSIVVFVEALTVTVRAPLLALVPLLGVAVLPGRIVTGRNDLGVIALTIALALLIVWLDRVRERPGRGFLTAAAITVLALVGGLIGQAVAPAFTDTRAAAATLAPVFTTGADPLVRLGDHLRRGADVPVLTYQTDSEQPVYLRVVTINDLSGEEWRTEPLEEAPAGQRSISQFPNPEGLADDVTRVVATTAVQDQTANRRWLPTPYPAVSIAGLPDTGAWAWQPGTLAVGGRADAEASGDYTVQSLVVEPTDEQLRASDSLPRTPGVGGLALPSDMPAIIAQTAQSVTAEATSDYDRAVAIQDYLRGGEFRYDEDTPEQANGDGDSFDVIATFLQEKRGYCVHYAAAMAVMARSLDIPARIAVGYQPGSRQIVPAGSFEVTSHDLHAWPELYFEGVGWTRFEPTPGRGDVPDYSVNQPASAAPSEAPTPTPSASQAAQDRPQDDTPAAAAAARGQFPPFIGGMLIALGALAVLAAPAGIRIMRRRRRLASAAAGASAVWQELHDTAIDLGIASAHLSPRSLVGVVEERLGRPESEFPGLEEWRRAAERARFGRGGADAPPVGTAVIGQVSADLRGGVGPVRRAWAVVLPFSLVTGALSRLARRRSTKEPAASRS